MFDLKNGFSILTNSMFEPLSANNNENSIDGIFLFEAFEGLSLVSQSNQCILKINVIWRSRTKKSLENNIPILIKEKQNKNKYNIKC